VVIAGAILLACAGWAFTFGLSLGSFWVKIGVTVTMVCLYSFLWQRPRIVFKWASLAAGLLSAVLLYAVFVVGNALAPYVVGGARAQIGGIYDLGTGSSVVGVFLLLMFVTGPGEEIFWRGFLQDRLERRLGRVSGYVAATLVYGGVHIFSGNAILILAALVAGAWWGAFYAWKKDLFSLIVSHAVWSGVVFAVLPIR
jgi:membrane protease YdiL (CAAX protease family)